MPRLKRNKILFFFTFSLSLNFYCADKYIGRNDLPPSLSTDKFILKYLKSIESVTKFYGKNVKDVDIHLAFGLFVTNVNFERIIKDYSSKIPADINKRLKNIIDKVKDVIQRFKYMDNRMEIISREHRQIITLFSNSTLWVQHVKNITHTKQKEHTMEELLNTYSSWKEYFKDVEEVNFSKPSPDLSDMCMVSLSINPTNYKNSLSVCNVADPCYSIFYSGSNFGYALCHRILLLQMARYGRACTILSQEEDDKLMAGFCSMAYAEADYIARNNYKLEDLMMEIICVCSLNGQGEFLDPIWLQNLLSFQSWRGCFGQRRRSARSGNDKFAWLGLSFRRRPKRHVCNTHTTGLAAGIFSTAIRYIIQEHES